LVVGSDAGGKTGAAGATAGGGGTMTGSAASFGFRRSFGTFSSLITDRLTIFAGVGNKNFGRFAGKIDKF
jgi:hypothetical protein